MRRFLELNSPTLDPCARISPFNLHQRGLFGSSSTSPKDVVSIILRYSRDEKSFRYLHLTGPVSYLLVATNVYGEYATLRALYPGSHAVYEN